MPGSCLAPSLSDPCPLAAAPLTAFPCLCTRPTPDGLASCPLHSLLAVQLWAVGVRTLADSLAGTHRLHTQPTCCLHAGRGVRKARSTYAAALTASYGDPALVIRWVRREVAAGHLRHALRIVESALVRHPGHPDLEQVLSPMPAALQVDQN